MAICFRCGRELDYTFRHLGKDFGSECIKVVTGKTPSKREKKNQVILLKKVTGMKYVSFEYDGKFYPMYKTEQMRWETEGDSVYVPKWRIEAIKEKKEKKWKR